MGIGIYSTPPKGTTRVQINAYGGLIEVDSDQVKMHLKKYACVQLAYSLRDDNSYEAKQKVEKAMKYIGNVNRRIRRTVQKVS